MYLRQRNEIWYFRRRVPSDLEDIIEPGRFQYSLGTRKRQEALKPYAAALAQSEHEISQAREKLKRAKENGHSSAISPWKLRQRAKAEKAKTVRTRVFCQYGEQELRLLVTRWFGKKKAEIEDVYRGAFVRNSPEERAEIVKTLSDDEQCLLGKVPGMDDVLISSEVRSILDEDDCDTPREWLNDPMFRRFYGLVTEGLLYLNRIATSLVQKGEVPERFQQLEAYAPSISQSAPFLGTGGKSITLDELISRFEEEPKRQNLREATRKEYHLAFRALREQIGGHKLLSEISRDDIRTVADTFLHLPARATLNNQSERLQDIAARAKTQGKPLADVKTYNKKVHHISAIFRYATVEQLIPSNPAQNLALPEPPPNGDEKGYTSEQLNVIFSGSFFLQFIEDGNACQFVPNHPLRPCYFWAPLIALFHGMRSGEILQLRTANVFERDGVSVLKLEGVVKNQFSYRIVPIHPEVKRLGFLEYVERVRKAGYEMVFPDAKKACDGKHSTWFQKPFSNYLTKIGVKTERKQCFHAFRHTWTGGMRRADVAQEIRQALGGWKRGDESSEIGYGSQHFPRLLKYLEKLEYPNLDLSHLTPKKTA